MTVSSNSNPNASASGIRIERERRYAIQSVPETLGSLLRMGASEKGTTKVTDWWYAPGWVTTFQQHEDWLRSDGAAPVRIREVVDVQSAHLTMSVKKLALHGSLESIESEVSIGSRHSAHDFLRLLDLHVVGTVSKTRTHLQFSGSITCAIDVFPEHPPVLELEVLYTNAVDSAPEVAWFERIAEGISALPGCVEMLNPPALTIVRSQLDQDRVEWGFG